MDDPLASAVILTGPTGSGKSALALRLAERLGMEIVSMDSMTLYRGMDIGTAKPSATERARVPHHLIDVLDPWESANVAWWLEQAIAACQAIIQRGKKPLFVGGTPFYLKCLFFGLFDSPPADESLRCELESEAEREGRDRLHARLAAVDPRTAARLHPHDVRRVVRALEVYLLTGQPISAWQQTWDTPAFVSSHEKAPAPVRQIPCVRLDWPRERLYERINYRVVAMFQAGLVDEVRRLLAGPRPLSREARQALGYRELIAHLSGDGSTLDQTIAAIQMHTRQFAKRQLTWFRHLPQCQVCPADSQDLEQQVQQLWGL